MRLAFAILLMALLGPSCSHVPKAPPPSDVKSSAPLRAASTEQQSKAAAAIGAAAFANDQNQAGAAKEATAGELSVATANLPPPADKDKVEALARANAALAGKLDEAQQKWELARADGAARLGRIAQLEAQVEAERKAAAIEMQRQLQAARDEERRKAEAEQRRIIAWIFYGGAFLLTVAAAVVLGTSQYVPFFGPKLAICLGIGAAASAALGAALNEILANPWIIRVLIGVVVAAVAGAVALGIANHHHHVDSRNPGTP
jgi:hypothetical protein